VVLVVAHVESSFQSFNLENFAKICLSSCQIRRLRERAYLRSSQLLSRLRRDIMATIPLIYQAFFLYIEPISTIVGAYYAWFQPQYYLDLTHPASAPGIFGVPLGTEVALRQLANLYLAFTLNEALVLRATSDLRVWKTLLFGLLVADFGHLYSCFPLGLSYYYDFQNWNAIAWGNIAFVYCGATLRTCFLLGFGLGAGKKVKAKGQKATKSLSTSVQSSSPASASGNPATPKKRGRKSKS